MSTKNAQSDNHVLAYQAPFAQQTWRVHCEEHRCAYALIESQRVELKLSGTFLKGRQFFYATGDSSCRKADVFKKTFLFWTDDGCLFSLFSHNAVHS